jgi:hypothetical protein
MPNIVYVLTNAAMPGIVKIGMTNRADVQLRMNELYSTGVPFPFECAIARQMEDNEALEIESALHTAFGPYRVNPSREFFQIEPEQAKVLLQVMHGKDATPSRDPQADAIPPEDREAASAFENRRTKATEQGFLDSLNEDGRRVLERMLAIGKQEGMRIKWGTTGFSLNAVVGGELVVLCYGWPRSPERPPGPFNQSIYSDFSSFRRKVGVPGMVVGDLRQKALDTGLFVSVGRGEEVRCTIDRRFTESEMDALLAWLERIAERAREPDDKTGSDSFHIEQSGVLPAEGA